MTSEGADPPASAAAREILAESLGSDPGALRVSPIEGGASRETFLLAGAGGRWVLRRDPGQAASINPLSLERRVIEAANAAGVPVAHVVAFEPEGGRLGSAALISEFVEGIAVGSRILRRPEYAGARRRLPQQCARALAGIHALDLRSFSDREPGVDPALAACELWEAELDRVREPLPGVEAGLRWLRLHRPAAPARPGLVHGDFRLGNLIVDETGLAAVIDWELCHPGDPAEDLAWLCIRSWRFGNDRLPVAGVGELEPFLDAYEAAGGERPDRNRFAWWEAMGNVKWAVICARQAHDHLVGVRRSAELASLGRRICEPEWDLLELLAGGDAGEGSDGEGDGSGDGEGDGSGLEAVRRPRGA